MPSKNYTTRVVRDIRIRVNVCEGEVHLTREHKSDRGLWEGVGGNGQIGPLTREQAAELADVIRHGLASGF